MREIQDTTGPNSDSSNSCNTKSFKEDSGWETNIISDGAREWSKEYNFKIIKLANKKSSLLELLKNRNIHFDIVYSPSGYTHKCRCPFPDHKDDSPSFFYNSIDDHFKCFGCSRNGGSVEFLFFLTGQKKTDIAKKILGNINSLDEVYDTIYEEIDDSFAEMMDDLAKFSREFFKSHKDKKHLVNIEKLFWGLDLYVEKYFGTDNYNKDDFAARIQYIKDRINIYGQNLNCR